MQCPFCKEEILDGAIKCKHCDSMLNKKPMTTSAAKGPVTYTDYSQVPWHRKNWFAILSWLIFFPVVLYLIVTGDIYYEKNGVLKTYSRGSKQFLAVAGVIYFIEGVSSLMK